MLLFYRKIAAEVGENIDVIVGGHSHSLLWNGKAPSKEYVSGPYPVLVNSENKPDHQVRIHHTTRISTVFPEDSILISNQK